MQGIYFVLILVTKIISHIINQLRSPCNARDVGDRTQNYSKLQYNLHRV